MSYPRWLYRKPVFRVKPLLFLAVVRVLDIEYQDAVFSTRIVFFPNEEKIGRVVAKVARQMQEAKKESLDNYWS